MTEKEVRKFAKQNYLQGKTKQETFEELKKISYRSTEDLEKILQAIPSLNIITEEIPIQEINKRFKKISFTGLGLLLIAHIFYLCNIYVLFVFFIVIIGLGLFAWIGIDYKMLQSIKHYIYCLLISIVFCGYYMIFVQKLNFDNIDRGTCMSLAPLLLLIVQKPTRLIFKYLYHREPVIDTPSPTVEDAVYELILISAMSILLLVVLFLL